MGCTSEKYSWASVLLGFVLVFVWGVISLAHAYDRSLTRMNASFTRGFMIVERLGAVLDAVSRISVDQQAFLSSGDARFQDGVVESAEALKIDISVLNSLAAKANVQSPALAKLARSIDQVLSMAGESDAIRQRRGAPAALAYFDSKETAISEARLQVTHLKDEINRHLSDRVRTARSPKALLRDVLGGAPREIALQHGAKAIRISANIGIE